MPTRASGFIKRYTVILAFLWSGALQASSVDGHGVLVGQGTLSVLFWDIYDARLYTTSGV